ncbi:SCP-2 sterol transfer family protein [Streptosporangium subroseum]|uniref:SCP-2 sterol transfer family protein n=1 Tax=Streptosporangium subroseum TaxID=106412 RepID=A0A239E1M9_9ACTN|nr:SCP-2 sterol transfer family protein [Streptosporangium subroseum]
MQIPPPVNHPARVAERIATLDLISDGRVDFGTGEASSAAELSGFGVPRGEKRAMWQDAIDAITRMFVEEPFAGWHSPYLRMHLRNVIPKTVQKPHPPLWVACSRRETIHLAARNGIGALSFSFVTPQEAARWLGEYYALLASEECLPAGFAVNPNLAVVLPMMCHEDLETARERGVQGANFFGFQGAIEFRLTGSDPALTGPTPWTIMIRGDRAFARQISVADPAVVLTLPGADLLRLIAGTADPAGLLAAGRVHLTGDPALASRLGEMFGGPSPY